MRTKFVLLVGMLLLAIGVMGQPGPKPGSSGANPTGTALGLTNVDYAKIVTPTTNNVYDVTVGYSLGLTTIQNFSGQTINVSAYNSKQWFIYQTQPLVLTNSVLPPAYLFWATNAPDTDIFSSPVFAFYTNLNVASDIWAANIGGSLGTNGSVVGTASWFDGMSNPLANNLFQFKTNVLVTYPQRNLLVNGTNATTMLATPLGDAITETNTDAAHLLINIAAGNKETYIQFCQTNGTPLGSGGGGLGYFGTEPAHDGGSGSGPTCEVKMISPNRIAISALNAIQIGGAFGNAQANAYAYFFPELYVPFVVAETNHSLGALFLTSDLLGGVTSRRHYAGVVAAHVSTNGVGSWWLGLSSHQSANFDAETGEKWVPSGTNQSVKIWGGTSNTVEFLTRVSFDVASDGSPLTNLNASSLGSGTVPTSVLGMAGGAVDLVAGQATVTTALANRTNAIIVTAETTNSVNSVSVSNIVADTSFKIVGPASATNRVHWFIYKP